MGLARMRPKFKGMVVIRGLRVNQDRQSIIKEGSRRLKSPGSRLHFENLLFGVVSPSAA
jgi:hypothetical protein